MTAVKIVWNRPSRDLLISHDNTHRSPDSVDTAGDDASRISAVFAYKIEVFEALAQSVLVAQRLDRGGGLAFEPDQNTGFEPWQLTAEFFEARFGGPGLPWGAAFPTAAPALNLKGSWIRFPCRISVSFRKSCIEQYGALKLRVALVKLFFECRHLV